MKPSFLIPQRSKLKQILQQHQAAKRKQLGVDYEHKRKSKKSSSISNLITTNTKLHKAKHNTKDSIIVNEQLNQINASADILNVSIIDLSLNELRTSNSESDVIKHRQSNDRYDEIDTPLNTSTMERKKQQNETLLNGTPASICNYYEQSAKGTNQKQKAQFNRNSLPNDNNVKINLAKAFNTHKHITVNRKKNLTKKHSYNGPTNHNNSSNNKVVLTKQLKRHHTPSYTNNNNNNSNSNNNTLTIHANILMKNYMNNKPKHQPYNSAVGAYYNSNNNINANTLKSNTKKATTNNSSVHHHNNKCKTASIDFQKNILNQLNNNTFTNNNNNLYTTAKKPKQQQQRRSSQQKPLMLYLDQMKYEAYFITPNSKQTNHTHTKTTKVNKWQNLTAKTTATQKDANNNKHSVPSSYSSSSKVKNNSFNHMKISKTLTEHNILNFIQATPKSKNSFLSSLTTVTKNGGYNNMNNNHNKKNCYTSSAKMNPVNPHLTMIRVVKAKTQSALKSTSNGLLLKANVQSGYDKDVKQKLLDRMNKATKGNWNCLCNNNNNTNNTNKKVDDKKKLIENISAIIQTPNKENKYITQGAGGIGVQQQQQQMNIQENGMLNYKMIIGDDDDGDDFFNS